VKTLDQQSTANPLTTPEPAPTPLTGREGLDLLRTSSAGVVGISLIDFLNTLEGKEAMKKKKIVLAGPPRSGKSCLRQGIKDAIRIASNGELYAYVLTACPDGEGAWFQESMNNNPQLAAKLKAEYKSKFSPEFAQRVADSVKNLSLPLSFIDIGGVISPENRQICEHANGAIFICGETAAKNNAVVEWKRFFTELGIPIVAELYSDYHGQEDIVDGVGGDGVFRGAVHHLERGETLTDRKTIKALAEFITNLGK
jgi:CRISPR-associated protein Csx3